MNYIYTLHDPRYSIVRYVGKTDNPARRLQMHLRDKDRCHRTNWIKALAADGIKPVLVIIEALPDDANWEERERYWIEHYRSHGNNLVNGSDGGDQGPNCTGKHLWKSPEALENIRAMLTARNTSPEMREISRRNGMRRKGQKLSPERIEKMRQYMTGRKIHTDEFKAMLAQRNRERYYDPEICRQNARKLWDDPVKGAEARAKLAERNRSRRK